MYQAVIPSTVEHLWENKARLSWIGPAPQYGKRIALLIPQYNESSNCNMESRLRYFKSVAETFRNDIDLVIIDDGSTDNSLEKVTLYLNKNRDAFFLAAVSPNQNKVGALNLVVRDISHEFVVLSDFDTDIVGYNKVVKAVEQLKTNVISMGFYFRMLPFEGKGAVFMFQQIEYAILRALYKFYEKDGSVPVMPGAGACYKRLELVTIYDEHSGRRNGEDREATMIGLKMGYRTYYIDDILTLTRPPLSFNALVKQRIRWNLGYLETYYKEKKYYSKQVRKLNRIGIIFMLDIGAVAFMTTLPAIILVLGVLNLNALFIFLLVIYILGILSGLGALLISPKEFAELKEKFLLTLMIYPFFKLTIGAISWIGALKAFRKSKIASL